MSWQLIEQMMKGWPQDIIVEKQDCERYHTKDITLVLNSMHLMIFTSKRQGVSTGNHVIIIQPAVYLSI